MTHAIETDIALDQADIQRLEALAKKLARKKKEAMAQQQPTAGRYVYVMQIWPAKEPVCCDNGALSPIDSMMSSGNSDLGMVIKGRKNAEHLCRQLEARFGKKFYIEEVSKLEKKY